MLSGGSADTPSTPSQPAQAAISRALTSAAFAKDPMNAKINKAMVYIDTHYAEPVRLAGLAAQLGVHPDYLSRRFKVEVGMRLHDYLLWRRLERAKYLLLSSPMSVKHIGDAVGFSNPEVFSRAFKRAAGCSPRAYRNRKGFALLTPRRTQDPGAPPRRHH